MGGTDFCFGQPWHFARGSVGGLSGRVKPPGAAEPWGVDLRVFPHKACLRLVVRSPNGGTTLAFLHFHGKPTLHLDMGGWSKGEGCKPNRALKASSKS